MVETYVVTGGAGFIGSHLVDSLANDGHDVVVIDDLSSGDAERVASRASLETVDLSDADAVDRVVDACRPGGIWHVGAQSSVTASVEHPRRDCAVNVLGTLNVLEASRRHGAPVVFTSTGGALYGNAAPRPSPEDLIPAPLAPYGASKWAAVAYVNTWAASTGLAHTICRLGNVYGPRQSPHGEAGVVAIISHQLWTGEIPTLYGFGEPTRDYVHVHDVVAALRRALGTPGTFNIATGRETSVRRILEILVQASGRATEPRLAPLRAGELERSCLDITRARDALGWRPELDIDDGVASTWAALSAEFDDARAAEARPER